MLIELDKLGSEQARDLLASAIIARPVAWMSTVNLRGEHKPLKPRQGK